MYWSSVATIEPNAAASTTPTTPMTAMAARAPSFRAAR
jgi:hypothetical protein